MSASEVTMRPLLRSPYRGGRAAGAPADSESPKRPPASPTPSAWLRASRLAALLLCSLASYAASLGNQMTAVGAGWWEARRGAASPLPLAATGASTPLLQGRRAAPLEAAEGGYAPEPLPEDADVMVPEPAQDDEPLLEEDEGEQPRPADADAAGADAVADVAEAEEAGASARAEERPNFKADPAATHEVTRRPLDPQIVADLAPWAAAGGFALADLLALRANDTRWPAANTRGGGKGGGGGRKLAPGAVAAPADARWHGLVAQPLPDRALAMTEYWTVDGVLYYDAASVAHMVAVHQYPVLYKLSSFLTIVRDSLTYVSRDAGRIVARAAERGGSGDVGSSGSAPAAVPAPPAAAGAGGPQPGGASFDPMRQHDVLLDGARMPAGAAAVPRTRRLRQPAPATGQGRQLLETAAEPLTAPPPAAADVAAAMPADPADADPRPPGDNTSPLFLLPDVYGLVNLDPLPALPGKPLHLASAPWPPRPPIDGGDWNGRRLSEATDADAAANAESASQGGARQLRQRRPAARRAPRERDASPSHTAMPSASVAPSRAPVRVPPAPVFSLCKSDAHWDVLYPNMYFKSPLYWKAEAARLKAVADRRGFRDRPARMWWRGTAGHHWPSNAARVRALAAWSGHEWADFAFVDNFTRTLHEWERPRRKPAAGGAPPPPPSRPPPVAGAAASVQAGAPAVAAVAPAAGRRLLQLPPGAPALPAQQPPAAPHKPTRLQQMGVPWRAWRVRSGRQFTMDIADVTKYKYALHLPGFFAGTYSRSLQFLLWTRAAVFMMESPYYEFYYRHLAPWTHYVPVSLERDDIVARWEDVQARPDRGESIGRAARAFAVERLSHRAVAWYWAQLLRAYARLQRFTVIRRGADGVPRDPSQFPRPADEVTAAAAAAADGRSLCTCWYINASTAEAVRAGPEYQRSITALVDAAAAAGFGTSHRALPRPSLPLEPFDMPPGTVPPRWVTVAGARHCGVLCRPHEIARIPMYRSWNRPWPAAAAAAAAAAQAPAPAVAATAAAPSAATTGVVSSGDEN